MPASCRRIALALVPALAVGASACVVKGGAAPPPGFSTAFTPDETEGGASMPLHAIDGTGAGNAWAVGEGGATLRQAGSSFRAVAPSGSTAALGGLSIFDVNHAFAVEAGGANVLAWTSAGWSPLGVPPTQPAAVSAATWASAPNDLWAAGDGIRHWDGTTWTQAVPSGTSFSALSGSFDTDVWAVGAGGAQHWNGHAWTAIALPTGTPALAAVWSSSLFDTWIVGAQSTVLHWNGTSLATVAVPTTTATVAKAFTSVSGTGTGDVWIGGQDGLLLHFDGAAWVEYEAPAMRTIEDLWTAVGADVLFVDGTSAIQRYVY